MIVYRIFNTKYSDSISGEGAYLYGGRWNKVESHMLYTSSTIALAALEILVHTPRIYLQKKYSLVKIKIPDNYFLNLEAKKLYKNWKNDISYCQNIGEDFQNDDSLLSATVPSAVIEEENNIIIKPKHKLFTQVKVIATTNFNFDERLLNR